MFLNQVSNEMEDIRQRTAWAAPGKGSQGNFAAALDLGSLHVSVKSDDEHDDEEDDDREDRLTHNYYGFLNCAKQSLSSTQ